MARLEDKPFDEYVTIKGPRGVNARTSQAPRQAADWLLYKMAGRGGHGQRLARAEGLPALEGKVETAAARQAKPSALRPRRPAPKPKKRKR